MENIHSLIFVLQLLQENWDLKSVKVSGDSDTDVVFTDAETGEQYIIGYITHGVTEKINLEKDKWYKVEGGGNLTLYPVSIRVEQLQVWKCDQYGQLVNQEKLC